MSDHLYHEVRRPVYLRMSKYVHNRTMTYPYLQRVFRVRRQVGSFALTVPVQEMWNA